LKAASVRQAGNPQRGDPGFCRRLVSIVTADEFGADAFMGRTFNLPRQEPLPLQIPNRSKSLIGARKKVR
jgi:hypothetical protein